MKRELSNRADWLRDRGDKKAHRKISRPALKSKSKMRLKKQLLNNCSGKD